MTPGVNTGGQLRSSGYTLEFGALSTDPLSLRHRVDRASIVAIRSDDAGLVAAGIGAFDGWAADVHLLPAGVEPHLGDHVRLTDEVVAAPPDAVVESVSPGGVDSALSTGWHVYSSGTTGTPRSVRHTLASLSRTVSTRRGRSALVWGLLYDPNRMAGLQVVLQAMSTGASLIAPAMNEPLARRVAELREGGVTALSATPTLWRQILPIVADRTWDLRQVTLGGEIADQPVLDALSAKFPDARIVHVFASTETGAAFSVADGRAGFPASYLSDAPRGITLDVRDGLLHIHAPALAEADVDGFVGTGDRVEVSGERVLFKGRDSGVVNIGGSNVWPEEVETILRSHPSVADAAVGARPNPLVGNLLVATVEMVTPMDERAAKKLLRSWVRDRAPATHVPATITVVDRIDVAATGKLQR